MSAGNNAKRGEGLGVDSAGGPVVDPTKNVLDLVEAESRRQDDLRSKDKEISDIKHTHSEIIDKLRAEHNATVGQLREGFQEKISHAESGRLDSIRQVDREEVAKTAVTANTAILALAKQTTDLQTTLQKQTADIAIAVEQRQSAYSSETNKRLSALELSSSEGKGKQQVSDPAMERMAAVVERIERQQQVGTGKSEGLSQGWAILGGAILLALAIYGGLFKTAAPPSAAVAPQVIYVPVPAAGNSAPVPGVR